jgi:hypothetical protein
MLILRHLIDMKILDEGKCAIAASHLTLVIFTGDIRNMCPCIFYIIAS